MINKYLSLCLVCISACFVRNTDADKAIIGGKLAEEDEFPYQVSLQIHGENYCGGGIIGEQFILTAAHCVINEENQFYTRRVHVFAGTNDLGRTTAPTVSVEVKKLYVPYNYKRFSTNHDIAVLKLKYPLRLTDHVKKIELPNLDDNVQPGLIAKFAGFGWHRLHNPNDENSDGIFDNRLRFSQVQVLRYCTVNYERLLLPEHVICAKLKHHNNYSPRGVCHGDSGGPLVHNDTVIGILSKGPKTCSEYVTGALYVRVSKYLDFINDSLRDKIGKKIHAYEFPE